MRKNDFFVLKTAGGAASQLLGLTNALYLSRRLNLNFKVKHYIYGVGTCYPFALKTLLRDNEILDLSFVHRGYLEQDSILPGMIVEDGPLQRISWERFYGLIRATRIDKELKWKMRKEMVLDAKKESLDKVSKNISSISGSFAPLSEPWLMSELENRFSNSSLTSPFDKPEGEHFDIVIHYRIGDIRLKYAIPTTVGDGIMSPETIRFLIEQIKYSRFQNKKLLSIGVVSDSPNLALKLLSEVGIKATIANTNFELWSDLQQMIDADVLIGSMSQVSAFASAVRSAKQKYSYLPNNNSIGKETNWTGEFIQKYLGKYLGAEHEIFDKKANKENNPVYGIYT